MALFAIADLHLPIGVDKPMDVFGDRWNNYVERIREEWSQCVQDGDWVVIPGDFCWAMRLFEAKPDFDFIEGLPGKKILLKGNHDYWWDTVGKLDKFVSQNCYTDIHFLQNNSYLYKDTAICGTRGWVCPGSDGFSEEDQKIYARELQRAELSLESAKGYNAAHTLFFMHYPPAKNNLSPDEGFARVFAKYGVEQVIYGHIHGNGHYSALMGEYDAVRYSLISADYLIFRPLKIVD